MNAVTVTELPTKTFADICTGTTGNTITFDLSDVGFTDIYAVNVSCRFTGTGDRAMIRIESYSLTHVDVMVSNVELITILGIEDVLVLSGQEDIEVHCQVEGR